jgi:hypothetical protein
MSRTIIAISTAILFSWSTSYAQQRPLAKSCEADIQSLCQGVQPGRSRIKNCIKAHLPDFSAPCQEAISKAVAKGRACRADIKKLCPDVKPGGGQIEACIKSRLSEISEPCKNALSEAAAEKS